MPGPRVDGRLRLGFDRRREGVMIAEHAEFTGTYDFDSARVADAMHRGIVTCSRGTSLVTVAHLMADQRIHCVAVVSTMPGGETTLFGVVSDRDVLAAAICGELSDDTAEGSARTELVTVTPADSLVRAAELMHERGLAHLIVVEPGTTTPIGVLSTLDVAAVVGRVWPEPKLPAAA
jgi:CBS domain-containing protein